MAIVVSALAITWFGIFDWTVLFVGICWRYCLSTNANQWNNTMIAFIFERRACNNGNGRMSLNKWHLTNKQWTNKGEKWTFFSSFFTNILRLWTTAHRTPNEARWWAYWRQKKLLNERAFVIEINELKLNCYRMYRESIWKYIYIFLVVHSWIDREFILRADAENWWH